ncbi:hypothetical protein RP20_CCG004716 [Aedes albopictus]|nr:hypothetical protein RP20_CCG004716 [Aedes albopictus]
MSISQSLSPLCSVFSAEAAAVYIAATKPSNRPIIILTDSASVVSALQSEKPTHPWIQGILLDALPGTTLAWIPGHCGIPGNTTADHLAGSGHSLPRYNESVPFDDVKRWLAKIFRESWNTEWAQQNSPYLRKIKPSTDRWEDLPLLKEQRIVSRLRTGHSRFSHSMSGDGPFRRICTYCDIRNTVEHVICVCPLYEFPRNIHGISGSIRDALGNDKAALASLICFLKDAGLYDQI